MTVHVVGSINLDTIVRVAVFPAPGETVLGSAARRVIGGKGANQALAATAAGARTTFTGAVGDDEAGRDALAQLRGAGIDIGGVRTTDAATGIALIAVDPSGENTIIVASGANALVDPSWCDRLALEAGDVVLVQGEVPVAAIDAAAAAAALGGARFVLNLAPPVEVSATTLAVCDPLVVNEHEASALGIAVDSAGGRVRSLVITLGAAGSAYADAQGKGTLPAAPAEVVDTIGAGDAFTGALAAALAGGAGLPAAVEAGAAYAAEIIGAVGANALAGSALISGSAS
ncbi:PfkB family carbohydrate kinase [Microbacterium fluvii]|uniref:Ribokinase n=1 Tax=Microbacterium fluvii TaxID=415215 RepID=A0ABW2HGB2_9MICO|nr:PfkB family carbohydrate kinase [Microbacterium fluvii]MCU4673114.1 PfkB family carbohydrate kinase [Microbacterium fluvii]